MTDINIIDPLGRALLAYHRSGVEQSITVLSTELEPESYKASYFFRTFSQMPKQEKMALKQSNGLVLDVGAGAGCHSLHLQSKGFEVHALDNSIGNCRVMSERGVKHVFAEDWRSFEGSYDTILLLMNGVGLAGSLEELPSFLEKMKSLLAPDGHILTDSSDIFHLYGDPEADEHLLIEKAYLGEVSFQFDYQGERSESFPWLYLDEKTFAFYAKQAGFDFDILFRKSQEGYLAKLTTSKKGK